MIGNGGDLFTPLLPRQTYAQVYKNCPDVIIAGASQPGGTAEAADGGWRVNGRWPFASVPACRLDAEALHHDRGR
jgi:hypothetical protein